MTINANQQQTTEVVCIKCDGSGIYTSPRGTTGKCFTCQGTGMQQPKADPMIRTNQGRQMVGNIPVSDRMRSDVLKAMIAIIEGKGERTKMTRVYDIRDYLKQVRNLEVSNEGISATLDSLINNKYVRFFKNDENYYFFGISAFGWHKWEHNLLPHLFQTKTHTFQSTVFTLTWMKPLNYLLLHVKDQVEQGKEQEYRGAEMYPKTLFFTWMTKGEATRLIIFVNGTHYYH